MKSYDLDQLDQLPGKRLKDGDTFAFHCHPRVSCFNQCCRNLNLFLYPYDVIRLKNALALSSDDFLEHHADMVLRPGHHFPDVLLRMADNAEKTCPFLTDHGCRVYADRPDTCRTFPVEQGRIFDPVRKRAVPVYFYRPPDFCMGQFEATRWTTDTWARDQEAIPYHRMTAAWAEISMGFQDNPWGTEGPEGPKARMTFMATYNIDRFREFIFDSSFLKRYRIKSPLKKQIARDDVALLKLGFDWVRLFLWGTPSKQIRPR